MPPACAPRPVPPAMLAGRLNMPSPTTDLTSTTVAILGPLVRKGCRGFLEDGLPGLTDTWLINDRCCPLRIGLWDPFQMGFFGL